MPDPVTTTQQTFALPGAMPPVATEQVPATIPPAREIGLPAQATGFVLYALRRLASPMRAFAAAKVTALAAFFASLFSGRIVGAWDQVGLRFEVVAADASGPQVAISATLVAGVVGANLALMLQRERAAATRIADITALLGHPDVPPHIKNRLADQVLHNT